jgi:PAS domain-containing protein
MQGITYLSKKRSVQKIGDHRPGLPLWTCFEHVPRLANRGKREGRVLLMEARLKKDDWALERRGAADALFASETRYRRLFEAAQDGTLILEGNSGLITDVNPFLVNLLDYPEKNLSAKHFGTLAHSEILQHQRQRFENCRRTVMSDMTICLLKAEMGAASTSSSSATCTGRTV